MNKKRIRLIVLIVAVVGICGYFLINKIIEKRRGLVLYGNVDIREVDLGFRVSGKIMDVLKDEGDSVKAGEVIARLDPEPYRRRVDEAKAQVTSLKAHADMMKKGYRVEEIEQAQSAVTERESTFANAQNVFARQKDLLATRAISRQDYDDAIQRFNEAKARLDSARQNLTQLNAGYRPEEIAQAQGDLQKVEAALASANLDLKDTELLAPNDGTIITRELEPGAIVAAGTPVLTLSLDKPVWVRAYVHEPELGLVHPGMMVKVFTDSQPDKPFTGKIGYISPRAEFTPKSVETPELRTMLVYRLRVVVDDPGPGLRQGMPVTVQIPKAQ